MKRNTYAIRDKKMQQFQNLCFFDNDAVAVRAFGDLVVRDTESIIHQHPSDFCLCRLGVFDSESGLFESLPAPSVVCDGDSFIVPVEKDSPDERA